jgi:hypothetical protein
MSTPLDADDDHHSSIADDDVPTIIDNPHHNESDITLKQIRRLSTPENIPPMSTNHK